MRIHFLQHVPFEGPAGITGWATDNGHSMRGTMLFRNDRLPAPESFDALVIMGGPMGANDDGIYPFIEPEKRLIEAAIKADKQVLGICLGAQLIASVLGAKVSVNKHREIGWFDVHKTDASALSSIFKPLPDAFTAFHWHGDTFAIPSGAVRCASSDACANQGFTFNNDRVLALQFHPETTPESAELLVENCARELDGGSYVQTVHELTGDPQKFAGLTPVFSSMMNMWARSGSEHR